MNTEQQLREALEGTIRFIRAIFGPKYDADISGACAALALPVTPPGMVPARECFVLRSMQDMEKHPGTYPVPFRVMWSQRAALDELARLVKVEEAAGSGITFSLVSCQSDALPVTPVRRDYRKVYPAHVYPCSEADALRLAAQHSDCPRVEYCEITEWRPMGEK